MFSRVSAISAALFGVALGLNGPAFADETAETAPVEVALPFDSQPTEIDQLVSVAPITTPDTPISIEHHSVIVESEQISVRLQRPDTDGILIEAKSIFTHLDDKVSIEGAVLSILRFQDGAEMTLDMTDGSVRANGVLLGELPDWEPREVADTWLSPNAIAVLSGCNVELDEAGGYTFTLDDRLRPKFDLDLWVNGERVSTTGQQPRTIGPVLLIPLGPVLEALGHTYVFDEEMNEITVTRIQDSAIMTLNISTGLVSVNGVPRGVTPNISYADGRTLMLPFSAVETLTGTHIVLQPGTSRIEVDLDDRLAGASLPGERVVDEAAETPFTPERLDFRLSDRGNNTAEFHSRYRGYNTNFRYETVGGPTRPAELQPSWMSLDIQALDGWRASLGDATTNLRELAGIDQTRIRGGSFRKLRDNGTILAIAAGVPVTGATAVGDNASKPTFGGMAAGVRVIDRARQQEIGVSASRSEDGTASRLVVGGQKEIDRQLDGQGLTNVFIAAEAGVFDDVTGTGVDARGRAEARYNLSKQASVQAIVSYDGARFVRGNTPSASDPVGLGGVFNDSVGARVVGTLSADWRAVEDWGPLSNVAGGVRTSYTKSGATTSTSISASSNARVGKAGPDISVDLATSRSTSSGDTSTTNAVNIRAFQRFDWGNVQAGYTHITNDGIADQRFVANVTLNPISKSLGDGATVTVGPSLSAVWTPDTVYARIGATAVVNSGQSLGDKFNVRAQFSALQSVDPDNTRTDVFTNVSASYDITQKIQLDASYNNNLRGSSDFRIGLRGSVLFNAPRKHTRPAEGTGVLKGRVFFDKNRDGIRQPDEPGLPGIRVKVRSTRLALMVDRDGLYTIQNMKTGLYGLMIDTRSLPLGMLVAEDMEPKVTIGDGRVTTADIPVIASGQIRGAVFIDTNSNGVADVGEERLTGIGLTLTLINQGNGDTETSEVFVARSAAFGQYSFENLAPGEYELVARDGRRVVKSHVTLTEDELFAVIPMAIEDDNAEIPDPDVEIEEAQPEFTA